MSQIRNQHRWYDAAQGLFSGTLPEAEAAAFAEELATNADAREFYLQLVQLDVALEWPGGADRTLAAEPVPPATAAPAPSEPATGEVAPSARGREPAAPSCRARGAVVAPGRFHRMVRRVARSAFWSILACGIGFYSYVVFITWGILDERQAGGVKQAGGLERAGDGRLEAGGQHVSTITGSDGAQWRTDATTDSNQKLEIRNQKSKVRPGEPLTVASGIVEMELKQGVKLAIEGPAEWSIDGTNRATLHRGKLVARVPDRAHGFTVITPTATIVDLGTEFGVIVGDSRQTEVAVTSGAIQLSAAAGAPIRLTERQSASLDTQGSIVERSDDGASQFNHLVALVRAGARPDPDLWVHEAFSEPRDGARLDRRHEGDGFRTIEWVAPAEGGIGPYPAFTLRNVNIALGSCFPKGVPFLSTAGMFEHCDASPGLQRATRYLPKPVNLGVDAEYFISFVAAKYGNHCHGTIGFVGDTPEPTIEAGWTYSEGNQADPLVIVAPDGTRTVSPDARFEAGGAVTFFVLRIVARAAEPDSACLYVFRPTDTLPAAPPKPPVGDAKPTCTMLVLPGFDSADQMNRLILNVDGPRCFIQFDEIRVGQSWRAVTGVGKDL